MNDPRAYHSLVIPDKQLTREKKVSGDLFWINQLNENILKRSMKKLRQIWWIERSGPYDKMFTS